MEKEKYCVTNWGAILKVVEIKANTVWVSDPKAVDAGMDIGINDIQLVFYVKG
jgi:hypothetical protein